MALNNLITIRNIILWRHAEAVALFNTDDMVNVDVVNDDMNRALTNNGLRQAKKMARWLDDNLPSNISLHCSPALRTFQTAQALDLKINMHQAFKPNTSLPLVLNKIADLPQQQNLLLVGHQPWMGQLAAHLLGINDAELSVKKGAIWWLRLSQAEPAHYQILTVQTPSML